MKSQLFYTVGCSISGEAAGGNLRLITLGSERVSTYLLNITLRSNEDWSGREFTPHPLSSARVQRNQTRIHSRRPA